MKLSVANKQFLHGWRSGWDNDVGKKVDVFLHESTATVSLTSTASRT